MSTISNSQVRSPQKKTEFKMPNANVNQAKLKIILKQLKKIDRNK